MPRAAKKKATAKTSRKNKPDKVKTGSIPSANLDKGFSAIRLPIRPPYPPAECKSVEEMPTGTGWLYEPKWDGFRCLAFRQGKQVQLQSKAGQPLHRYFPQLVESLSTLPQTRFVLDSEIVVYVHSQLSFENLLMRIHPGCL